MILVGSLQYSPVYVSHCYAFGNACEKKGYIIRYIFSHEYKWMISDDVKKRTFFIGNSKNIFTMIKDCLIYKNILNINSILKNKYDFIYMHNYHLLNHYISKQSKHYGTKFVYHLHEPYVINKKLHGGFQQYWLYLYEFMESLLLRDTDVVIVSSKEASKLFNKRYPWFEGKKMEIPLMYEDVGKSNTPLSDRKYITFVGPPVPAKGPDIFLNIVDYSNNHNLGWKFLLITREKIYNLKFYDKKNLKIYYKEKISDNEFAFLIQNSVIVVTPYKRETQSSVVLVSFMHGVPVISSNVGGLPEFVKHKKTGFIVDINDPIEVWVMGITYLLNNFNILSYNCRKYFSENFSGDNWDKYLDLILQA